MNIFSICTDLDFYPSHCLTYVGQGHHLPEDTSSPRELLRQQTIFWSSIPGHSFTCCFFSSFAQHSGFYFFQVLNVSTPQAPSSVFLPICMWYLSTLFQNIKHHLLHSCMLIFTSIPYQLWMATQLAPYQGTTQTLTLPMQHPPVSWSPSFPMSSLLMTLQVH